MSSKSKNKRQAWEGLGNSWGMRGDMLPCSQWGVLLFSHDCPPVFPCSHWIPFFWEYWKFQSYQYCVTILASSSRVPRSSQACLISFSNKTPKLKTKTLMTIENILRICLLCMCLFMGVNMGEASYTKIELLMKHAIWCSVSPSILPLKDNFKLANVVRPEGYYFLRDKHRGRGMARAPKITSNQVIHNPKYIRRYNNFVIIYKRLGI